MKTHIHRQEIEYQKSVETMRKIIEKQNYESSYPMPLPLKRMKLSNPKSFFVQLLGSRGCGKSTLINNLMKKGAVPKLTYETLAKTGIYETTTITQFFDITDTVSNIPDRYNRVFLCDQPGIGGLEITEADYLANFGPGKHNLYIQS